MLLLYAKMEMNEGTVGSFLRFLSHWNFKYKRTVQMRLK